MPVMDQSARQSSLLRSALAAKCPRCSRGALYAGPVSLDLRNSCEICGLDYAFIDSGDGPAVFVIMILGFLILGLALFVEFTFAPPLWVHVAVWTPLALLLGFALLKVLKALLIALQFKHAAHEGRLAGD